MKTRLTDVQAIIQQHTNYWDRRRETMNQLTAVYAGRMWDHERIAIPDTQIRVETPDGYGYVESYVASLYPKAPAVEVATGPDDKGDADIAAAIINRFLDGKQADFESMLRYGFILPFSAVKLHVANRQRASVLDMVDVTVIKPWDIIIDPKASKWDAQRYVGHRYWVPITEAKSRWGSSKTDWVPSQSVDYLEPNKLTDSEEPVSELLGFVEVYEIYNFISDEMVIWSPNYHAKEGFVWRAPIPLRAGDGSPLAPIIPYYSSEDIQTPLRGASTLGRVYDQLRETNLLRTAVANAVRRDARIILARKGVLEDSFSKDALIENRDGSIVEINVPADQSIASAIMPLPSIPLSLDFERYKAEIRADLDRGSFLAPFTRGEATSATATEVAALQVYASKEIGRLALRRDTAITQIAQVFLRIVSALIQDPDTVWDKEVISLNGETHVLTAESISGNFRIASADQAATPLSATVKRQRLLELLPALQSMGVPPDALLTQVVREFNLPEAFLPQNWKDKPTSMIPPVSEATPEPESQVTLGGGPAGQELRAEAPNTQGGE